MRQRVAVARALAMNPEILLLDEPLSALDALTRARLQDEIEAIWRRQRKTVILVTNDVDEALLLADRIIPLTPGPRATLGQEFKVDFARPRDRTTDQPQRGLSAPAGGDHPVPAGCRRAAGRCPIDRASCLPEVVPINAIQGDAAAPHRRSPRRTLTSSSSSTRSARSIRRSQGPLTVVDRFNLNIRKGEFISLIGHSGCGKSTVLSMVAGLNDISDGGIVLDGREVVSAGPDRGVVFQAPSLLPWLTARENVALGVERVYPHVERGRATRHRRLLPDARRPRRCAGQAGQRTVERHEAARRSGACLCAGAEAAAAGRAFRHARRADTLGPAGSADGRVAAATGSRRSASRTMSTRRSCWRIGSS